MWQGRGALIWEDEKPREAKMRQESRGSQRKHGGGKGSRAVSSTD